jgi:uncharacterized membrane protein (DUF4010 family)
MSDLLETILSLGLALALGLLVGMERGWQERGAAEGRRIAGIRTFGLIALLGGLAELLARGAGEILLGIAFFALVLLLAIAHVAEASESKDYGVTTLIAALITFVLGALTMRSEHTIAATGAVVTTIVLSLKPVLHRWLQRITPAELAAALKLLLISVVILPILPDRGYGPWQALNPYELWWIVVLLAAISFAAYAAVKIAGPEWGILLTGFLGGIVSSTAVSIHLARLAGSLTQTNILVAGVLVASATMFLRVFVLVGVLNFGLLRSLCLPLLAMAVCLAGAAGLYARKSGQSQIESFKLRNPVELGQALQFGLLLALIFLATKAAQAWLGEAGLYLVATVSGVADVDAITISLARLAGGEIALRSVSLAVFIAASVNTVTKTVLVAVLGGGKIGAKVALPIASSLALGAALIWTLE